MNLDTVKYIFKHPENLFTMLGSKGLLNWIPDPVYVYIYSSLSLGYSVNLKNPSNFNEKLQWLKLYDRRPEYSRLVDKYAVRGYVEETVGADYLVPLVGGPWKSAEEIDFDALPQRFVLKTTHDSGTVLICKDKSAFDIEAAKKLLNKRLRRNYYWGNREWQYKDVPPRIIAEQYMENDDGSPLTDCKFYCFNGEPKLMYITQSISEDARVDFFDMDFNPVELQMFRPRSEVPPAMPPHFEDMKRIARIMSADKPHLRVDFYTVNGKLYMGELTFFQTGGTIRLNPRHWEQTFGDWIELPEKRSLK